QDQLAALQAAAVVVPEQGPVRCQTNQRDRGGPETGRNETVVQVQRDEVRLPAAGESGQDCLPGGTWWGDEIDRPTRTEGQAVARLSMSAQVLIGKGSADGAEQVAARHGPPLGIH